MRRGRRPRFRHPAGHRSARSGAPSSSPPGSAIVAAWPDGPRSVSADIVRLAEHLPATVQAGLLGVVSAVRARDTSGTHRPRHLVAAARGSRGRAGRIHRRRDPGPPAPGQLVRRRARRRRLWKLACRASHGSPGRRFPSASYLAGRAAVTTVLSPSLSRPVAPSRLDLGRHPRLRSDPDGGGGPHPAGHAPSPWGSPWGRRLLGLGSPARHFDLAVITRALRHRRPLSSTALELEEGRLRCPDS